MKIRLFGITGKKASGKSSVAKFIRQNNIPVVNIDHIYDNLFQPGTKVHREIINCFDYDFLTDAGEIDLKRLSVALCEKEWVKNIIDDIMKEEISIFIERLIYMFSFHKIDIAGIESEVLLNTIMKDYSDYIIMIEAPLKDRCDRLKKLIDESIIKNIIDMENKSKWNNYNLLIENNGSIEELEQKTIMAIKELLLFFKRRGI